MRPACPERVFEGTVRPRKTVVFRVPSEQPGLAGWTDTSRSLLLERAARHGERIAKDGEILRFAFPAEAVKQSVEKRIELARARQARDLADLDDGLRALEAGLALARLQASKASLERKKKGVLSKRDSQLVDLAVRGAELEIEASERRIEARRGVRAAVEAQHAERLRQAQMEIAELAELETRFRIRAPRAGRVIWPPSLRPAGPVLPLRLPRGERLCELAVDGTLVVDFGLPACQRRGVAVGSALEVRAPGSGRKARAVVESIQLLARPAGTADAEPIFGVRAVLTGHSVRKGRGFEPGQRVELTPGTPCPQDAQPAGRESGAGAPGPDKAAVSRGALWAEIGPGRVGFARTQRVYAPDLQAAEALEIDFIAPEGTRLELGQPLARFSADAPARALGRAGDRLALARAALERKTRESAEQRLDLALAAERAAIELERAELLAVEGIGLRSALRSAGARLDRDAARLRVRLAKEALASFDRKRDADLVLARLAVERAEQHLGRCRRDVEQLSLAAPAPGVLIASVDALEPGRRAVSGEPLCELADPASLAVLLTLDATSARRARPGARLRVGLGCDPSVRVETELGPISPDLHAAAALDADRAAAAGLFPGADAMVEIELSADALLLPARAMVERDGVAGVWLAGPGGLPVFQPIEPGARMGETIEVRSGLSEGQQVWLELPPPGPAREPEQPAAEAVREGGP
ncbi:MAG: hypothetical protein JXR96_21815 [Deltaproteobacteria bacterium]|nr:hypothetical protein [Deltaproteobacteria bacterium]